MLSTHGHVPVTAKPEHYGVNKYLPSSTCNSIDCVTFWLFEGIVDGYWERRVRLLSQATIALSNSRKRIAASYCTAVKVGSSYQLLSFRHKESCEFGPTRTK